MLLTLPTHVHRRTSPHGGDVLLNETTGLLYTVNPTAAELLKAVDAGGGVADCVQALQRRFPGMSAELLKEDVTHLVREMVQEGLLELQMPVSMSVEMAGERVEGPVRLGAAVVALVCLLCAHLLLRMSFAAACALVGKVRARRKLRAIRPEEAEAMVSAIRWAAARYPGRTACLETSLAATLWGLLRGIRLEWCIGFTVEPYRFHAWVEAERKPVMEQAMEYQKLMAW